MPASALLPLLLLHAVTVEPSSFPAGGRHEALLRVDAPSMVRLTADDPSGTSCELTDHQRGPFASSGVPGKESCRLDALLDAGVYKVRLEGARNARGTTTLRATGFAELNGSPERLTPGSEARLELRSGQQASFWLRVTQRGPIAFRASGRTAGVLHVWRDGQWLEELGATRREVEVEPGQPIHEWWLERVLEPGDYRITVYGTDEARWTRGKAHEVLSVALGFPEAPEGRSTELPLPPWGFSALLLPKHRTVALLSMEQAASGATSLDLFRMGDDGRTSVSSDSGASRCAIQPKALVPECAVHSGADARHVLVVRGLPGTKVALQWAPQLDEAHAVSGTYATGARTVFAFVPPATGEYLLATHDVPVDEDAPPLSCVLERAQLPSTATALPDWTTRWDVVARDELAVSRARPFRRAFNHDGNSTRVWFRVGDAGQYRITTSGERNSRCELWATVSGQRQRIGSTELRPGVCDLRPHLDEGSYELVLYQGTPGIERVRIATEDALEGADTTGKAACRFDRLQLDGSGYYRVSLSRGGAVAARGFFLERGPISLSQPLSVVVEPRGKVALRLVGGQDVVARAVGSALRCTWNGAEVGTGTRCTFSTGRATATLELINTGNTSLPVTLQRPAIPAVIAALAPHQVEQVKLQAIETGQPVHLDFDRQQQHSRVFRVEAPGLYDVTTTGLLSTACDIRTPVVTRLASDTSGGRGRNCLVAQYLRPGEYLLSVRTVGQSRGRGGVVVERRPVHVLERLVADDQVFFRAEAGELVQQPLVTREEGAHRVSTAAPGAALQCRLEDDEGWPVVRVPTACEGSFTLPAGRFLWTQLPLTVESMRHTRLQRDRGAEVLRGDKEHPVALNTTYAAELGEDGRDEYALTMPVALDVRVSLTHGMQARIYRLGEGAPKPVEQVPPDGAQLIHLPIGRYRIVTEHSRTDVGITYQLRISTGILVPGTGLDVQAPTRVPLRLGAAGTLRLQTEGGTDVRCRVLDENGRQLFDSTGHGADWNCALAEPFEAGDYTVVIESETQRPGATRITAALLDVKHVGALSSETSIALDAAVQVFELPGAGDDVVRDLALHSSERFSCVLEAPDGAVVFRKTDVTECAVLTRLPKGRPTLRLWTQARSASVSATHLLRPIQPLDGARIPAGSAARAEIPRAGRYRTSGGVFCLPEGRRGALLPCRDEVSLEPGPVVFSSFGPSGEAPLSLSEIVSTLTPVTSAASAADDDGTAGIAVGGRAFIQRTRSERNTVQVLEVRLPLGESTAVSCGLEGGVRSITATRCAAASGRTNEAVARWSMPVAEPVTAELALGTLPWPKDAHSLAPGVHTLSWSGEAVRLSLPERPARVDLLVPPKAWVVQLDRKGAALDLCAPESALSRCVLAGAGGGEVLVHTTADSRAEARVTLLEVPQRVEVLSGLFEADPRLPGRIRFELPESTGPRRLEVEGAERCEVILADGRRSTGCTREVPAKLRGVLVVDHGASPLRALLYAPGGRDQTLFAMPRPSETKPLSDAMTLRLSGAVVARTLTLGDRAAVHVRADSGVCALWPASGGPLIAAEGLGAGCSVDRVLPPGTYLLAVRGFGAVPPTGELTWNRTPVEALREGINDERWIAPGPSRFFRFEVAAEGKVGLGLQVPAEALSCTLYDAKHAQLGTGCQQYLSLPAGEYLLEVRASASSSALPYRPVLFGLSGSRIGVPEDYLRDFFQRIGVSR